MNAKKSTKEQLLRWFNSLEVNRAAKVTVTTIFTFHSDSSRVIESHVDVSHDGPHTPEAPGQSDGLSLGTKNSHAQPAPCQPKMKLPPLQTGWRESHLERREDNTLYHRETGLEIPPTPEGKPDFDRFLHETCFPGVPRSSIQYLR